MLGHFDIWLLKKTKKTFFFKIEACGQKIQFSKIIEDIKENCNNLSD